MRSGCVAKQPEGCQAFIPAPLPPDPPIQMDDEFQRLLSNADRSPRRLDGVASVTAAKRVHQFASLGLLKEITGQRRNRRYRYDPYLALYHTPPIQN